MKFFYFFSLFILFLSSCNKTKNSMLLQTNLNKFLINPPIVQYPFNFYHSTFCSQGNNNKNGSHSHDNINHAIDFLTPPLDLPGKIFSSHDGIAYVFDKCSFRNSDYKYYNLDNCGSGYGNHIKILHKEGYITIYAHLSKIFIKNLTFVKARTPIGIEGLSGNAGKRHLHFGVHYPQSLKLLNEPGYTGKSIPFKMRLIINKKRVTLSSINFPCNNDLTAGLISGSE